LHTTVANPVKDPICTIAVHVEPHPIKESVKTAVALMASRVDVVVSAAPDLKSLGG
jgi:hypothetical protein